MSRFVSIIGFVAGAVGAVAPLLSSLPGKYGALIAGLGAGLAAFNERIQGGLSKQR